MQVPLAQPLRAIVKSSLQSRWAVVSAGWVHGRRWLAQQFVLRTLSRAQGFGLGLRLGGCAPSKQELCDQLVAIGCAPKRAIERPGGSEEDAASCSAAHDKAAPPPSPLPFSSLAGCTFKQRSS